MMMMMKASCLWPQTMMTIVFLCSRHKSHFDAPKKLSLQRTLPTMCTGHLTMPFCNEVLFAIVFSSKVSKNRKCEKVIRHCRRWEDPGKGIEAWATQIKGICSQLYWLFRRLVRSNPNLAGMVLQLSHTMSNVLPMQYGRDGCVPVSVLHFRES